MDVAPCMLTWVTRILTSPSVPTERVRNPTGACMYPCKYQNPGIVARHQHPRCLHTPSTSSVASTQCTVAVTVSACVGGSAGCFRAAARHCATSFHSVSKSYTRHSATRADVACPSIYLSSSAVSSRPGCETVWRDGQTDRQADNLRRAAASPLTLHHLQPWKPHGNPIRRNVGSSASVPQSTSALPPPRMRVVWCPVCTIRRAT